MRGGVPSVPGAWRHYFFFWNAEARVIFSGRGAGRRECGHALEAREKLPPMATDGMSTAKKFIRSADTSSTAQISRHHGSNMATTHHTLRAPVGIVFMPL